MYISFIPEHLKHQYWAARYGKLTIWTIVEDREQSKVTSIAVFS